MTPEEPTPAPVPESAPPSAAAVEAPPPAPVADAPSAAPPEAPSSLPAEDDARVQPAQDMWQAMLGRLQDGSAHPEPDPEPKPSPKPQPRPRPGEQPAQPAVSPAPRQWAGQYESPDALESAYKELQAKHDRAETERQRQVDHAERIERLLMATMQGQAYTPPGVDPQQWRAQQQAAQQAAAQPPQHLQDALQVIKQETERIALGDAQANPLALERARAYVAYHDPETRRYYEDSAVRANQQRMEQQQQLDSVRSNFFKEHPDLEKAEPSLLRQLAIQTEATLRQSRRDYGSAEFMKAWFDQTAQMARQHLRLGDGAVSAPANVPPVRPQPVAPSAKTRGAPFAESPSPRPTEPVLSGQAVHLARVFGRGA